MSRRQSDRLKNKPTFKMPKKEDIWKNIPSSESKNNVFSADILPASSRVKEYTRETHRYNQDELETFNDELTEFQDDFIVADDEPVSDESDSSQSDDELKIKELSDQNSDEDTIDSSSSRGTIFSVPKDSIEHTPDSQRSFDSAFINAPRKSGKRPRIVSDSEGDEDQSSKRPLRRLILPESHDDFRPVSSPESSASLEKSDYCDDNDVLVSERIARCYDEKETKKQFKFASWKEARDKALIKTLHSTAVDAPAP